MTPGIARIASTASRGTGSVAPEPAARHVEVGALVDRRLGLVAQPARDAEPRDEGEERGHDAADRDRAPERVQQDGADAGRGDPEQRPHAPTVRDGRREGSRRRRRPGSARSARSRGRHARVERRVPVREIERRPEPEPSDEALERPALRSRALGPGPGLRHDGRGSRGPEGDEEAKDGRGACVAADHFAGSSTTRRPSISGPASVCARPLGQRISSGRSSSPSPRPKWSVLRRLREVAARGVHLADERRGRPTVSVTSAPIASRLLPRPDQAQLDPVRASASGSCRG